MAIALSLHFAGDDFNDSKCTLPEMFICGVIMSEASIESPLACCSIMESGIPS